MIPIERRSFLALTLGASVLAAGAGRAFAAAGPVKGGTLIAVINPEPPILTNTVNNHFSVNVVSPNIYDGLLSYDQQMNPIPALAERFEVSPDKLSITFHLRKGVTWHDGTPFTSRDVAYSVLELWKKHHPRGRTTFGDVTAVDTPDAATAVLRLSRPSAIILNALSAAESQVLPAHLYENTDARTNPRNINPVGTGPFRFVEWKRGEYIALERNPTYWDAGKPYVDRLIFRIIPDAASRAAAFETGEVVYGPFDPIPLADAARLRANPELALTTAGYQWLSPFFTFEFNVKSKIAGDVRVRRAIAHAIDRKGLIEAAWYGFGTPATGPIPHYQKAYTKDVAGYPFDPAAAERLLDEAGYKRGADGVRFALWHDYSNDTESQQNTAEFLRQNLKAVGIDLKLRAADLPTYYKRVYTNYDYDTRSGQFSAMIDPSLGLYRLYATSSIAPGVPNTNGAQYSNPELDAVIETALRESDPARRTEAFHAWQRIAMTDLPNIPLFELERVTLHNRKVKGLEDRPDAAFSSLKNLWLEGGA
ncbi:ABC transporter substrate-binding protein (plasmid) [Azospirillum sp. TSH58]|uniref:ABC transporter substrate-binding protein n=1 Tax=Azospirillum sp. TSH58 TaxID=664962 RepID=UPI000D602F59|nr:ABC transporter substrate-binding protein [Azospirillum sp. TSH58]AWJ87887.1 ABC transporter substrate-binding protein [Azospirillum sp. TSH58]